MTKLKSFSVVHKTGESITSPFTGTADAVVNWLKKCSDVSKYQVFDAYAPTGMQYLSVSDFLRQNIIPEIYSQVVPKYYAMDPETEDMLPDGGRLMDGMKVLIADPDCREHLQALSAEPPVEWLRDKIMERNRWCTVSHLKLTNHNNTVAFIAIYEDGTKRQYRMGLEYAWLVKLDSIPDPVLAEEKEAERYNKIYEIVIAAFDKHDDHCCMRCNGGKDAPSNESLAVEATKAILGALG